MSRCAGFLLHKECRFVIASVSVFVTHYKHKLKYNVVGPTMDANQERRGGYLVESYDGPRRKYGYKRHYGLDDTRVMLVSRRVGN